MDEEEKLWQQLLQQGYSIQTAVTESRKILDKLPGSLREDGINLLYKWLTESRAKLLALAAEEMEYIYTNLGNGINHELCMKFVQSGCDLDVIDEGLQEKKRRE